jgi:ABC-type polysaccharide/polyol phosphate transport system ATPase subunit
MIVQGVVLMCFVIWMDYREQNLNHRDHFGKVHHPSLTQNDGFIIENVSASFRTFGIVIKSQFKALDNITLAGNVGECVGLIGPNGCGKSTVFQILAKNVPYEKGGNISILERNFAVYFNQL